MPRMVGPEVLDAALLQLLADRLEKAPAMLLHQRLEERHAEHFAFTLVDERREIVVHVIAEEMAMEKRPAAVRLHEQLDGGLFLGLAAEDLGDDALQLAAITLIDQPAAPGDKGVGAGDQRRQPGDTAFHQLARL